MAEKNLPRGLKNKNPGNIRHGSKWQGAATEQADPEFVTFESPAWGIRAMARVLITYKDKYDINTVRGIINRWAPPKGDRNGSKPGGEYTQNTGAYIRAVAAKLNVGADQVIDLYHYDVMRPLIEAIIAHENGQQPYSRAELDEGLRRAGIVRKQSAFKDPETLASGGVAAGTVTVAGTALYTEISQVSSDLREQGKESGDHTLILAGSSLSLLAVSALVFLAVKKWRARR